VDGLFLQCTSHDRWTNGTFLILADQMSLAVVYASVMSGSVVDNVMVLTGILIVSVVHLSGLLVILLLGSVVYKLVPCCFLLLGQVHTKSR
jgi:hypothetical protein